MYKEDFDKFIEGLTESVDFIKTSAPEPIVDEEKVEESAENVEEKGELVSENYTDVDFEDLDAKEE